MKLHTASSYDEQTSISLYNLLRILQGFRIIDDDIEFSQRIVNVKAKTYVYEVSFYN